MDTKKIVNKQLNALTTEREMLRQQFRAELEVLGDKAKTAAQHEVGALPTLAWVETSLARLRELREAFERAEHARTALRRVADAIEIESTALADA